MTYSDNLSNEQKLDCVLEYLVSLPKDDYVNSDNVVDRIEAFSHRKEVYEILIKLTKDGYINTHSSMGTGTYVSNFDGRMFIQNGGYEAQAKRDQLQLTIAVQNETRTVRNERLLVNGTWFAGVAAVVLFLWQVWMWFYPVHKDYPYWFWEKIPVEKHAMHK